jgi:hypothetical protein
MQSSPVSIVAAIAAIAGLQDCRILPISSSHLTHGFARVAFAAWAFYFMRLPFDARILD